MIPALSTQAAAVGVTLAGSVIAVPPAQRHGLARALTAAGHWVHADRIEGSFRGQPGVDLDELPDLAGVPGVRLDVHLMVDDPVAELGGLPGDGITRLTVQCDGIGDLADLVRHGRGVAAQVWLAVHSADADADADAARLGRSGADGVLVLLTRPGQPGQRADLDRLALVRAACQAGLPAGVDGGVTAANLDAVAGAGARYAVVGRALLPGVAF